MFRHQVVSGPGLSLTGTFTSGSAVITGIASTQYVLVGSLVLSSGLIPPDTLVASVDSATQITLTQNATANGSQTFHCHNEPVTLAQAKAQARIDIADDDPLIAGYITSARKLVELNTGLKLINTTIDYFADSWPWLGGYLNRVIRSQAVFGPMPYWLPSSNSGILDLKLMPLNSVTWVKYRDFNSVMQTIPSNQYRYDTVDVGSSLVTPSRIQPEYTFTWPVPQPVIDSVNIRVVCGFGADYTAVPQNLKDAIKMIVAHWYNNREHVVVGVIPEKIQDTVDSLCAVSDPGSY